MAGSNEIIIAMSSTEDDIRKLYDASMMGSVQILNTLLEEDPNLIKKLSMISTSNIGSPLHVSVSHRHLEFTRVLLDHGPELVVEVDAFQRTPLHVAAKEGYTNIVQVLLEKNTSACLVHDKKGLIPLHYAIIKGHIEVIRELIKARPQSIWMKLESGQTILHLCVKGNHLEGLKLLMETVANHNKDFLNTIDRAGNTILDMSMKLRQMETVRYLLSIPEVKTGRILTNSVGRKKSSGSNMKKSKKCMRERQELLASPPTKKKRGCWNMIKNKLKYKGNWVQEVQGIMMLVATVIATVTFQAGINPPGGVWQQDTPYNNSTNNFGYENGYTYEAGTAIMLNRGGLYTLYSAANTMSFLASVSVIMLIISRFPLQNRICSMLLALYMFLAVFFLTVGYIYGVTMVTRDPGSLVTRLTLGPEILSIHFASYAYFGWLLVVCLIGLWHFLRILVWLVKRLWRILVWLVKRLWRIFSFMLKSKCFNITIPPKLGRLNSF